MKKPTLCVIFGGKSSEYEVSLRSAYNVLSLLDREKYELVRIGITKKGEWYLFEGKDEEILNDTWSIGRLCPVSPDFSSGCLLVHHKDMYIIDIDLFFPAMHGENAEDGRLQGVFDMWGSKYVGCGAFASHLCMDKGITKKIAASLGIAVAKYVTVGKGGDNSAPYILKGDEVEKTALLSALAGEHLDFPLFVKPATCGSSVGAALVHNQAELFAALDSALSHSPSALIEEYVCGDEVEVGVIETGGNVTVSPSGTIRHKGVFYDYKTKYARRDTEYQIPSQIDEKTEKYLRECGKRLFLELGCEGLCRFDFFLCGDRVIFNEANTMPGFTDTSMFLMLFEKCGIDKKSLVNALIESGLKKSFD